MLSGDALIDTYEVELAIPDGTRVNSVIRDGVNGVILKSVETGYILDEFNYNNFWVTWAANELEVWDFFFQFMLNLSILSPLSLSNY